MFNSTKEVATQTDIPTSEFDEYIKDQDLVNPIRTNEKVHDNKYIITIKRTATIRDNTLSVLNLKIIKTIPTSYGIITIHDKGFAVIKAKDELNTYYLFRPDDVIPVGTYDTFTEGSRVSYNLVIQDNGYFESKNVTLLGFNWV